MKTYTLVCQNEKDMEAYIKKQELSNYQHVFVQVYMGLPSKEAICKIQQEISKHLPQAFLIGATTDARIVNQEILMKQIVITFTVFNKTKMKTLLLSKDEELEVDDFQLGRKLASELVVSDTKVLLLFVCGESIEAQDILDGIQKEKGKVLICGAISSMGGVKDSYIFNQSKICSNGVVAISLNSKTLKAKTISNYSWKEVGYPFSITKSDGKRVYSIANKEPLLLLEHYFGKDYVESLPSSSSIFPFQLDRHGRKQYVFISKVHTDGSVELSKKVQNEEKVTLSFPKVDTLIEEVAKEIQYLADMPAESIFVFNCIARKKYLRFIVEHELNMLSQIANTSGFFAYGEFITLENGDSESIGNALTVLALSEGNAARKTIKLKTDMSISENERSILALSHLIHASTKDIEVLHASMEESQQRYKSLFDNHTDVVYSTDLAGNFTSVNQAFVKAFGYKEEEILYKNALDYIHKNDVPRVTKYLEEARNGKEQNFNIEVVSKHGKTQLYQITNIPIIVNGVKVGIYGIAKNITKIRMNEEKILNYAYFDIDTGLPNRLKFTETLGSYLKTAKGNQRKLAVAFVDIDGFKIVNDTFGHFASDEILKQIADRIKSCLPPKSDLGRFAGDKFTFILSENVSTNHIIEVARKVLHKISIPVLFDNQEFFVTASIGVSISPNDGFDEDTLLKNADIAMNRAKQQGGNRIKFYSTEMNQEALYRLELESYLRKALENNEFHLCYQPLIDLATGKVYGSEALLRWNHPKLGLIPPSEFIPVAEETGLIHEIGRWVLHTACKQNRIWQKKGLGKLTVSINVSAKQFQRPNFIDEVKETIMESGLAPRYLVLELTESIMLRNVSHSILVMKELQKLGVKVSVDDFGTGYSSLSYLKDLPIDNLKIDQSFIHNLKLNSSDIAIVKAIITMGHGLAVKVVAEGVESAEQMKLLKELKCHYAQGFYIHKPLSIHDFENSLAKFPRLSLKK